MDTAGMVAGAASVHVADLIPQGPLDGTARFVVGQTRGLEVADDPFFLLASTFAAVTIGVWLLWKGLNSESRANS